MQSKVSKACWMQYQSQRMKESMIEEREAIAAALGCFFFFAFSLFPPLSTLVLLSWETLPPLKSVSSFSIIRLSFIRTKARSESPGWRLPSVIGLRHSAACVHDDAAAAASPSPSSPCGDTLYSGRCADVRAADGRRKHHKE